MVPAKERGRGWSFAQGKGFGLGQVGTGRSDDSGFVLVLRGCPGVVLQSRNQRRPSVQHVAINISLVNFEAELELEIALKSWGGEAGVGDGDNLD